MTNPDDNALVAKMRQALSGNGGLYRSCHGRASRPGASAPRTGLTHAEIIRQQEANNG